MKSLKVQCHRSNITRLGQCLLNSYHISILWHYLVYCFWRDMLSIYEYPGILGDNPRWYLWWLIGTWLEARGKQEKKTLHFPFINPIFSSYTKWDCRKGVTSSIRLPKDRSLKTFIFIANNHQSQSPGLMSLVNL